MRRFTAQRSFGAAWFSLCALALAVAPARAAVTRRVPPPTVHLTWSAPFGDTRARTAITPACRDTTRLDTLWLTFETERVIHHMSISGALLFEPEVADTLAEFWHFERGGPNAGNLNVEFDIPKGDQTNPPWRGPVDGHVGYTRAGGRGRLDLSANGENAAGEPLEPGRRYVFAQVIIRSRNTTLGGCRRPVSIRWVGARFPTRFEGDLRVPLGPGQQVTWNAPRRGFERGGTRLAVETWTPVMAPPSWTALFHMRPAMGIITRTPRDSVSLDPR